MPRLKVSKWISILIVFTLLIGTLTTVYATPSLVFDKNAYTLNTLTKDGLTITYRAYKDIVYVSNPVETEYQSMNFYVPEAYYKAKSINGYTANNAPIFLPITVGGYKPGKPGAIVGGLPRERKSIFYGLLNGYVVAAPGARGSTNKSGDKYTGKAPACIVDLKAAVRYLHHNDKIMPGDAEKIITSGTSAGGALSSLLGATGNHKDYEPYLKEIGAADERDDIFAASCYCPIQNLDNSDTAMEWQFNHVDTFTPPPDWKTKKFTEDQKKISAELKAMFPAYLNSLGLRAFEPRNEKGVGLKHAPAKVKKGTLLTLDANGDGNFRDYVVSFVIESAQKALDVGNKLKFDWITIEEGTVTGIDFSRFTEEPTYPGRLFFKQPPAFDALKLGTYENVLFGTATIDEQHFTRYGFDNTKISNPSMADKTVVKMLNPTYYIGAKETTTAQYWRIRHGTIDHHTSLAIPVILATMLENNGYDVNFALPWEVDHGGDYDLHELFAWINLICQK